MTKDSPKCGQESTKWSDRGFTNVVNRGVATLLKGTLKITFTRRLGKGSEEQKERHDVITVDFEDVGPGQCSWCQSDKHEVFIVFVRNGSLKRKLSLCMKDFRHYITLEVRGSKTAEPDVPLLTKEKH